MFIICTYRLMRHRRRRDPRIIFIPSNLVMRFSFCNEEKKRKTKRRTHESRISTISRLAHDTMEVGCYNEKYNVHQNETISLFIVVSFSTFSSSLKSLLGITTSSLLSFRSRLELLYSLSHLRIIVVFFTFQTVDLFSSSV